MWNAIQVANVFKIARETVRQYSLEFGKYLSAAANPGKNRTRVYNQDDMEVFALIVQMKGQGKQYPDIHGALANGDRGLLPNGTEATALSAQPRYTQLQLKLDFLEGELKTAQAQIEQDRGQIDLLERQLEAAHAEIKSLNREIGRLEANIKQP